MRFAFPAKKESFYESHCPERAMLVKIGVHSKYFADALFLHYAWWLFGKSVLPLYSNVSSELSCIFMIDAVPLRAARSL